MVTDRYFSPGVCQKLRSLLVTKDKNIRLIATHLLQYFSVSKANFWLLRKERMHYIIAYCLEQDPRSV